MAVEKFLKEHKIILTSLRDTRNHTEKIRSDFKDKACSKDISLWIDNSYGVTVVTVENLNSGS